MKSPDERVVKVQHDAAREGLRLIKAFEKIKDPATRQKIISAAEKAARDQD